MCRGMTRRLPQKTHTYYISIVEDLEQSEYESYATDVIRARYMIP